MRFEAHTKFLCNGCRDTTDRPIGWKELRSVQIPGQPVVTSLNGTTDDFCQDCVHQMRQALR